MRNLRSVLDSLLPSDDAYHIDAPESWAQGRTLYGGITLALCAHAATLAVSDLPPLRSAQVGFIGPASGRLGFEPRILRRGRSATSVGVDATGEAGLAARALLVHGGDRDSVIAHDLVAMPAVPPPDACEHFLDGEAHWPAFMQNFEMRLAAGARPVSGAEHPQFDVWVRHRSAAGVDPVIALLALADCLPPAAMTVLASRPVISTVSWMIDLFHPVPAGDWHLLRSTSEQAAVGYSLQAMSLWDESGRRLAAGRQTVALFA